MTFNTQLTKLRALVAKEPSPEALQAIVEHLEAWPEDADREEGFRYALGHLTQWPDHLRHAPEAWRERVLRPHIPDDDPLDAALRPFSTDGYDEGTAETLPFQDSLMACEACELCFDEDPRLWVGWSGSSITCIHCFFAMHYEPFHEEGEDADTMEFIANKRNEAREPIGGIPGYIALCSPGHTSARCANPRSCFLCDARSS